MEGIFDLGIANSIQKKFDCEFFALVDVNRYIKKTFQNQNIVNFKKIWYFQDSIEKPIQKPDLEYLTSFEKKYNINLWLIAYKERHFYLYNNYYRFSRDEILRIIEQECRFFEKILSESNPNFAIIKIPDYQHNILLQEMCKAKNIKILTLNHTRIGYQYLISEETDKVDNQDKLLENYSNPKERSLDELLKLMKEYSKQVSVVPHEYHVSVMEQLKASLRYLFLVCNKEYQKYFVNFGRTRGRVLINESSSTLKRFYRESFINKNLICKFDDSSPYVYFPLHFQPERSTIVAVPFYQNQLEVIKNIARSLPVDFKLYVKEHPIQVKYGWRRISFYKTIMVMPNVELIHPSISNEFLLKNCSLVITIGGTPGLEAAFFKKPSIVFTDVGYSWLPSVFRIKNLEDLPKTIHSSLDNKVNLSDLNKYVSFILENSFEHDNIEFDVKMLKRFFYGGFLYDVKISQKEMNTVFEENKFMFEKLAMEYIKKINTHKQKL